MVTILKGRSAPPAWLATATASAGPRAPLSFSVESTSVMIKRGRARAVVPGLPTNHQRRLSMAFATAPATAPVKVDLSHMDEDALVAVEVVAALLNVSVRHVWRLADRGVLVAPLRLGASRRWRLGDLRRWLRGGARPARAS
jgi:predicted DNA-binding transcriptional regulator AlpA